MLINIPKYFTRNLLKWLQVLKPKLAMKYAKVAEETKKVLSDIGGDKETI